jgi:hypothetical protein
VGPVLAPEVILKTALLVVEKWNARISAVFESFVYRIAANWTLSKLARSR